VAQLGNLSQSVSPKLQTLQDSESRRDAANYNVAEERWKGSSMSPTKENSAPFEVEQGNEESDLKRIKTSSSAAILPSRNSPLSWQRRPNSQSSDRPRSGLLSMVATENATQSPRATPTPEPTSASVAEPTLSRDQIAQSLASKDPAWFRQTADRGMNSPAYRRNQVEDQDRSDYGSNSSRIQMSGMSREASESDKNMDESTNRSSSPSRSSTRNSFLATASVPGSLGSPIPLTSAQRFDPPGSDSRPEVRMSPSQGRISPDRPASPTKGMGGFVQSAMMKRSDSVSKRWSVQSPPGLSRGNSVASNRSSQDPSTGIALGSILNASGRHSGPNSLSRENSPHPTSRPTSSHSNATVTQDRPNTASSMRSSMTTSTSNDGFVKSARPASRSHTLQGAKSSQEDSSGDKQTRVEVTPPTSPSKTMDPKRWSPTKSSWLESALNKPESPKPKVAPPLQQPAWMSEINKAKQKGSADLGRSPTVGPKHEVNIGGLMRSPLPGGLAKPLSIGGLPTGFSSGNITKDRPEGGASPESTVSAKPSDITEASTSMSNPTAKYSPANAKEKPETPPKKDFRSNLKPRQLPTDNGGTGEPEFKNVFGQLRRTKTQNYVAPDELKDNITRGKAGLNITGGPKKTERKDEFKEAILKKKEDFKKAQLEGKGVTKSTSNGSQEAMVPEALAKRKMLGGSNSTATDTEPGTSESLSRQRTVVESPKPSLSKEASAPGRLEGKEAIGGKLAGRFNPALAGLLARGPPSMASDTSRSSSPASSQRTVSLSTSTTNAENPEAGPQLTHMTKGRARGPRRKAPSTVPVARGSTLPDAGDAIPSSAVSALSTRIVEAPTPLKTAQITEESSSQVDTKNPVSQPPSPGKLDIKRHSQFLQEVPNTNKKAESQLDSPKPISPTKKANPPEISMKLQEPKRDPRTTPITKAKPSTPIKSPTLTSKSSERAPVTVTDQPKSPEPNRFRRSPLYPSKPITVDSPPKSVSSTAKETTNPSLEIKNDQPENLKWQGEPESPVSVRNAAALWDRPSGTKTVSNPPRAPSPIKLPTQEDERAAMVGAGLRSSSPVKEKAIIGLGLKTTTQSTSTSARPLPTPPAKGPLSPPPSAGFMSSGSPLKSIHSPVPQSSEASKLLAGFFGDRDSPADFVTDTAAMLSARPGQGSSIKTLRASLYQLSADGKKQPVPNHQERILFEQNMYLCFHTFGNEVGKRVNEVYHWIGDDVPESTVESVEILAQREAKNSGAKLIKMRQGKETQSLFHALGGIIIIRRGSANKYDSLAPHILCGRQHFGQIAFDEVDYSPSSLCSGFSYLISTQSGKSYLWKGKGSGIDELSCARLIGMDFGLTGEIEEVEDGNEPTSFLQLFGNGAKIPKSADHWRMKPNYNKYCGRLFCADNTAREQVSP
jgi:hypothetical protein